MMNITTIAIGLLVISSLGIVGLLIYLRIVKHKYNKNSALFAKDKLVVKNRSNPKDIFDKVFQVVYLTFIKMPILSYYSKKTLLNLEMTNDYTEYELRRRTGKYMLLTVLFVFLALFILLNLVI